MSPHVKHAPRVPIGIRGGIRAQSNRSLHGRPWWSRRWLDVIEGFRLGARLGRGRSYALSGQVAQLEITPGCVAATVQGSSPEPYRSEIKLRQLDAAGRKRVLAAINDRPVLAARLLVRDLPREVEPLFVQAACPLFPARTNDITTTCTCPDWANPCKHLAAVYFLLGEALDRDPLLLLTLRGIRREDLVECGGPKSEVRGPRSEVRPSASTICPPPADIGLRTSDIRHPTSDLGLRTSDLRSPTSDLGPRSFWGVDLPAFEDYGPALKNAVAAPLVYRLGALPFWRGQERFLDAMDGVYTRAAPLGWSVWTGEPTTFRRVEPLPPSDESAGRLRRQRMQMDVLMR
jgi:uncharacterized Zn finger protein